MTDKRRTYTKRQKVTAVIAAEMTNVSAAAEAQGVPMTTVAYWMDMPEYVELRKKTREEFAEETRVLAHKVLGEIGKRLAEFEPRDLSVLYGILTDKSQLLSGQATGRVETRDITDSMDDHERELLGQVLRSAVKETADAGG